MRSLIFMLSQRRNKGKVSKGSYLLANPVERISFTLLGSIVSVDQTVRLGFFGLVDNLVETFQGLYSRQQLDSEARYYSCGGATYLINFVGINIYSGQDPENLCVVRHDANKE